MVTEGGICSQVQCGAGRKSIMAERKSAARRGGRIVLAGLALALSMKVMSAAPAFQKGSAAAAQKRIREETKKITADRTPEQIRAQLAGWKAREPNSPEPYLVSASYELSLSRQPTVVYDFDTHGIARSYTPRGNEFSIIDPKSGEEVGVIGEVPTGPKPDAETAKKQQRRAAAELGEGLKKFSNCLDLIMARSLALAEARDWEALATQLQSAFQRALSQPEKLRWPTARGNYSPDS